MSYPLGQSVALAFSTFAPDGTTPTDPTALTLVVTLPDATTETFNWPTPADVTRDSTGVFHYDYTGPAAGTYLFRFASTGAATAVAEGQFEIDAQTRYIVSIDDLKSHLNDPTMTAASEAKLRTFAAAATRVIEHLCGTVIPAEVTEILDPIDRATVALSEPHVLAVDTVHEGINGTLTELVEDEFETAGAVDGYRRDGASIYRTSGGVHTSFTEGARVRVVYTAGLDPMPEDVELAAKELLRFWWQPSQLGSMSDAGPLARSGGGTGTVLVAGFLVPNAVVALLAPHRRNPTTDDGKPAPASRTLSFDPQRGSLYHGGPR